MHGSGCIVQGIVHEGAAPMGGGRNRARSSGRVVQHIVHCGGAAPMVGGRDRATSSGHIVQHIVHGEAARPGGDGHRQRPGNAATRCPSVVEGAPAGGAVAGKVP
eukprot:11217928-Lingulodinium_polyedra.AAC.1